ncbi:sensor histidine kinase [Leucobacter luti]|uniref:sensor histidine kinase n=1 Tax=Leucobacter luti TaxID=340320 RepID=UPI003D0447C8
MTQAPGRRYPVLWWDIAVVGVLVFLGAVGLVNAEDPRSVHPALVLAPLVAFLVVYVVLGHAALRRVAWEQQAVRADLVYLVLIVVIAGAAAAVDPSFATLQAVCFPMLWVIVDEYRSAISWSVGLAVAVAVGSIVSYERRGSDYPVLSALLIAALSLAFAIAMGTWITRIFERSEAHRQLAEKLQSSQAEVAALSQEAGASAERERLSRELHDTLTQTLAGLVMLTEQADRALAAGDTPRAAERIDRVGAAARAAVVEARALVATTQPLGEGGLAASIERVAARIAADTGLAVECRIAPLELDRELQVVLLRAAQEGLSNVWKHADARRVEVSLAADGDGAGPGARLVVEDDGRGPAGHDGAAAAGAQEAASLAAPAGFGLSGLADRVRAAGGSVEFGPRDGGGARLEVRVPLTTMGALAAEPEQAPTPRAESQDQNAVGSES